MELSKLRSVCSLQDPFNWVIKRELCTDGELVMESEFGLLIVTQRGRRYPNLLNVQLEHFNHICFAPFLFGGRGLGFSLGVRLTGGWAFHYLASLNDNGRLRVNNYLLGRMFGLLQALLDSKFLFPFDNSLLTLPYLIVNGCFLILFFILNWVQNLLGLRNLPV